MKTYELKKFRAKNSKKAAETLYLGTLKEAQEAAKGLKYHTICEFEEDKNGILMHSYGMYYFRSF